LTTIETIYQPEYEKEKEVTGEEALEYLYSEAFTSGLESKRDLYRLRKCFEGFRKMAIPIVIEEGDKQYRIEPFSTPIYPEDIILVIKNPRRFVELIIQFENEKEKTIAGTGGKLRNTWAAYKESASLWGSATPFDFQNPEQFLQKQIAQIKDETFANYSEWEPVAESTQLGEYAFIKRIVPIAEYESPHELDIAFSETDPKPTDCLPAIRYGRVTEDTVIIYAIQMPLLEDLTEKLIHKRIEQSFEDVSEIADNLRKFYETEKDRYVEIFGEIPEEILELSSPEEFIVRYADFLAVTAKRNGYRDIYDLGFYKNGRQIPNLSEEMRLVHYKFGILENAANKIKGRGRLEQILEKFNERRKRLSRLNKPMSGNVPSNLRNVPPGAVVSLCLAAKMFHNLGVRKILIPTYMPLRMHTDEDEQDEKILMQNANVCQRVEHEVEGFEISYGPESDGYLHIRLSDTLTSTRPFLAELFESVDSLK